jgi:hypothetical protein
MKGRTMMAARTLVSLFVAGCLLYLTGCAHTPELRQRVSLDGAWEIAEGSMDQAPARFPARIAVPGLVDMAQPAFKEVGKKSGLRQAFWYRRTFTVDGPVPDVAILKIHKARYGAKVFLNGKLVGEHLPCFTPALLNVKGSLKGDGQPNEIVIRVGADRESMPQDMPTGWDFEKYLYIPGIYDSVELVLTAAPHIVNVQTVPDIEKKTVRVIAEIQAGDQPTATAYTAQVREWKSGKIVGSIKGEAADIPAGQTKKVDFTIPIDNCRLWSPDDPFLYQLTLTTEIRRVGLAHQGTGGPSPPYKLTTSGDQLKTRFGMRSFTFDPKTKRAMLNGKPYYMRGTNVTAYRFFEDAARGDKPWRAEWVRRLHQQYKTMHWNSIRYCIGFPPEIWYDIADEEGFLIQDEFPIWLLGKAPENPKAEKIIPEYIEWMRERWNHACVVIWDGQNESFTDQTGIAIKAVRDLDLSQRPWENGWAEPGRPTDFVESHPYLFSRGWGGKEFFYLRELEKTSGVPHLQAAQKKLDVAIIINEYDWLWLTRDGNPTCLTDKVYESLLGKASTVEQRRLIHARYVAALTEFWRAHRNAAGVLHFCGLGYSRPGDKPRPEGGATSDDFIDLEKLTFEPHFAEYVREAFNPVGLMLDFWAEQLPAGSHRDFGVYVINDLERNWTGDVRLRILRGKQTISVQPRKCSVAPLGREIITISQTMPVEPGEYTIVAELTDKSGKTIRSLRDVKVK